MDAMSSAFEADLRDRVEYLRLILHIVDTSTSIAAAARTIRQNRHVRKDVKLCDVIFRLPCEISKLEVCLQELPHCRSMALRVLDAMFLDDEKFFAFNQEICFSYACKMLAGLGPRRRHFANHASLTASDIQKAELHLALHSPSLFTGPDMSCHEHMMDSPRDRLASVSSASTTPSTVASSEIGQDLEAHDIAALEALLGEGDHAEDAVVLV